MGDGARPEVTGDEAPALDAAAAFLKLFGWTDEEIAALDEDEDV